ncbi:MAG: fibronectin type III domain-containing protein, partial [Myxococcota bacterium]
HRHGQTWPLVVFQNNDDRNLSHPLGQSSHETFYCRPLREGELQWDTTTCSSTVFTDKGVLSDRESSRYPPRSDLIHDSDTDHHSVASFESLNPFDAVSRPTPPGDEPFQLLWSIPAELPDGAYTMWAEVSKEFDQNEFYDYPSPLGIPWSDYGLPARGQPSVVYRVPFEIGAAEAIASTASYAGYGDPDGLDGMVREPDGSITTGVDGSGASRLLLSAIGDDMYRLRVTAQSGFDEVQPGAPQEMSVLDTIDRQLNAIFVAPGDDLTEGMVTGYEVRYQAAEPITENNFLQARLAATTIFPEQPGTMQEFTLDNLVPRTHYYVAVRAFDECKNYGPITVLEFSTEEREVGEVPWCFVATAAYGSALDRDVDMLRRFRDRFLRSNVTGELLVEGYYTFGPALAKLIAPSDTARRAARAGLAPLVEVIRDLAPSR